MPNKPNLPNESFGTHLHSQGRPLVLRAVQVFGSFGMFGNLGGSMAYRDNAKYVSIPLELKQKLFDEVKADERYEDYLYGCYECGICVSACPSARFYDYSPRVIAQTMAREDLNRFYEILTDDIWNCAQCFSCVRCPRGNSPGGLVTIIREIAVRNGLKETKEVLQGYSRVIYKVMLKGNQVSPDMLRPDFFPDWGPWVKTFSENMKEWRMAIPTETLRGTYDAAWKTDAKTLRELYYIWYSTGNLELIKEVDPGLHDLIAEVVEEELAETDWVN